MNRVDQMTKIQAEALELFTRKNADYGDAFAKYGVIGVLMRIEDNYPSPKTASILLPTREYPPLVDKRGATEGCSS